MKSNKISDLATSYGRLVYLTAYRILGSVEAAEDVLQDVFLKLLENRRRSLFMGKIKDWGAYLRVLATHRAIDVARRKPELSLERDLGSDDGMHKDPHLEPDAKLIRNQKACALRIALRSLPPRDAELFVLRYFEELTYAELARHLDLNQNQVGVILHRARGRLRALLSSDSGPWRDVLRKTKKHQPSRN